jgi:predicted PurR-regulated permease PerM
VSITSEIKLPVYAKAIIILVGLIALFTILYIAQSIIVPLVFATIVSILLHPIVNFFVKFRINKIISILITLLLTLIVFAALGTLVISQISRLSDAWPLLVEKITGFLNQSTSWVSEYFDIKPQKLNEWILTTKEELINTSGAAIGQTLVRIGSIVFVLLLVPVYIFLLLYYQPLLLEFIHKLFGAKNHSQVSEIVKQTKTVIQHYLIGLVIEAALVATMYITALFILGIDYAILIGIIGAFLNLIPYVGGLVGVALPMIVALATKPSPWTAVYVLAIFYFIQLIDNNLIVPKVVAGKVKINALFSILVVIAGSALWGIPGMFLAIPMLAIIKVIFDHIEPLKPWGFLLGDTMPPILTIKPIIKKIKKHLND